MNNFLKLILCCAVGAATGAAVRAWVYDTARSSEVPVREIQSEPEEVAPVRSGGFGDAPKTAGPLNPVFSRPLEVRGYAQWGKRVIVTLSDGSRLTERDPELWAVERNSVTIGPGKKTDANASLGVKYAIKPAPLVFGGRSEGSGEVRSVVGEVKASGEYTGAANPGLLPYRGESVVPLNDPVDTSFSMGVGH